MRILIYDKKYKRVYDVYDLYEVLISNLPDIFTKRQNSGTFWDRQEFEKRFEVVYEPRN